MIWPVNKKRKNQYLLDRRTGKNIRPWIKPSTTIPNTILKKMRNPSAPENAVINIPKNVLTPVIIYEMNVIHSFIQETPLTLWPSGINPSGKLFQKLPIFILLDISRKIYNLVAKFDTIEKNLCISHSRTVQIKTQNPRENQKPKKIGFVL